MYRRLLSDAQSSWWWGRLSDTSEDPTASSTTTPRPNIEPTTVSDAYSSTELSSVPGTDIQLTDEYPVSIPTNDTDVSMGLEARNDGSSYRLWGIGLMFIGGAIVLVVILVCVVIYRRCPIRCLWSRRDVEESNSSIANYLELEGQTPMDNDSAPTVQQSPDNRGDGNDDSVRNDQHFFLI